MLSTTRVRLAPGGITQTVNFTIRAAGTGLSGAPSEPTRYYVGDVGITPAVTLWNVGSDTNVFNRTDAATRDTTFTLTRDAGVTGFLKKPISTRLLFDRISSALTDTRMFIRTGGFFGPDRRHGQSQWYQGPLRRQSDKGPETLDLDDLRASA